METFVRVGQSEVHVVETGAQGPAAAHTAVLLHGMMLDHRSTLGAFEPSFQHRPTWRRVYVDLPGMGLSRAGDDVSSTDDVFRVVDEVLAQVVPEGRAAVCGSSYGAGLARGLVAKDPDRWVGMCLVVPDLDIGASPPSLPEHLTIHRDATFLGSLPVDVAADFTDWAVVADERVFSRVDDEIDSGVRVADHAALARIGEAYRAGFSVDLTEPFGAPCLLVHGRQDARTGYTGGMQVLEQYPRATLAVLDRAGHYLPIEQDALFRALVDEWLDRVEEYARQTSSDQPSDVEVS